MASISYVDPGWAEAIAWDPDSADDDLWAELHTRGDLDAVSLVGLAPEVARELGETKA